MEEAFGWQHIDRRMVAVEAAAGGLTKELTRTSALVEQWWPVVNRCVAKLDEVTQRQAEFEGGVEQFLRSELPSLRKVLEGVSSSMSELGDRMTSLEKSVEHVGGQTTALDKRLADHDSRLKALETVAIEKTAAGAERRRLFSLAHAVAAALFTVAGAIAGYLLT